ncbi:MAG: hypothetical protein D3921_16095, partial [Candidatus Electrothrix sp. AW1]|nr:hypothetical protein [Candidatus Electrothrix gigas]
SRLCRTYQPDMVAITGYYPARDQMLAYARTVRVLQPEAAVLVGGVHAELQQEDFQRPEVDLIVHSGGVLTFQKTLTRERADWQNLAGISWQDEQGQWRKNAPAEFDPSALPHPDRSFFHAHKQGFSCSIMALLPW